MMGAGLLPGLIWCAIGIPVGRYLGQRAANLWRLYLTRTALHYRESRNPVCSCCSSADDTVMIHVSLSDVQAITVETNYMERSLCGCDAKTLPTTVKVVLKPGCRHDLLPHWCNRPLIEVCLTTSESCCNFHATNVQSSYQNKSHVVYLLLEIILSGPLLLPIGHSIVGRHFSPQQNITTQK